MNKSKLIFTEESIWAILEALDKAVNEHGFVIDKTTKEFALDAEGKKFKPKQIVAISKDEWCTNVFQMTNA